MKKIIYKLILKYPLIILLLKTPLKKIFINYMRKFRYREKTNLLDELLSYFFWIEYFSKLENPEEIRKITNSTLDDGEGRKWAEEYFRGHFKTIENLHNTKFGNFGLMTLNDANPIFSEIIKYIKDNHLSEDKGTFIIQIGSSSGMDLKFFYDQFPKLNYISTDINDEILNFQKEKYDFPNFKFFKCYAEEIDKCFEQFNLEAKRIILFSYGSTQYVVPYFVNIFFSKIKFHKNLILFLNEPIDLRFFKTSEVAIKQQRGNISFSHNYKQHAQKNNLKIIKEQIIEPHSKDDPVHKYTGHYYLCCKTN